MYFSAVCFNEQFFLNFPIFLTVISKNQLNGPQKQIQSTILGRELQEFLKWFTHQRIHSQKNDHFDNTIHKTLRKKKRTTQFLTAISHRSTHSTLINIIENLNQKEILQLKVFFYAHYTIHLIKNSHTHDKKHVSQLEKMNATASNRFTIIGGATD